MTGLSVMRSRSAARRNRSARARRIGGAELAGTTSFKGEAEELAMQVREVMSRDVRVASPSDTLQQAAKMMAELDAGVLPVGENDRLVGMITDRDIAIRGDAEGRDPTRTPVREIMTEATVKYCFEDEDVEHVAQNMAQLQVRRLPVMNRQKRLVGVVSLGDLSTRGDSSAAGEALRGISREGGPTSQSKD
jgi:CBS domain-containing protein